MQAKISKLQVIFGLSSNHITDLIAFSSTDEVNQCVWISVRDAPVSEMTMLSISSRFLIIIRPSGVAAQQEERQHTIALKDMKSWSSGSRFT